MQAMGAGEIFYLCLAEHHPEHCKQSRALAMVVEDGEYGEERTVHRAWSDFKPAAHLWAAHRLIFSSDEANLSDDSPWAWAASMAEYFRLQAIRYRLRGATLLWPLEWAPKAPGGDISAFVQEIPARQLEFLNRHYRPLE